MIQAPPSNLLSCTVMNKSCCAVNNLGKLIKLKTKLVFGRRGTGNMDQLSLQPGLSWDLPQHSSACTAPSVRQHGSRQVGFFLTLCISTLLLSL